MVLWQSVQCDPASLDRTLSSYPSRVKVVPSQEQGGSLPSLLISWVMGAVLTAVLYRRGRWKQRSVVREG